MQAAAIAEHPDWIRHVARPLVGLVRSTLPPARAGSKLGGAPDLPEEVRWPTHGEGSYRFAGQINFGELGPQRVGLPASGLLSLFVADDEDQSVSWQEEQYVRAFFFTDTSELVRRESPTSPSEPQGFAVRFADPAVDLPREGTQRSDWPDGLAEPLVEWWRERQPRFVAYLLGYPAVSTLAYDPTPGPEWTSLLTLSSNDELGWSWHDGAYLHVFIERARLAQSDFSIETLVRRGVRLWGL